MIQQPDPIPGPPSSGRPGLIAAELRARILGGELGPGDRVPNREELQVRYAASPATVQKALDGLIADGFVVPRGRAGTFVAARPPHVDRYALVFEHSPDVGEGFWSSSWQALVDQSRQLEAASGVRMPVFRGVDGHVDSQDGQRLFAEIKRQRLTGLIFGERPRFLNDSPLLLDPGMPRVGVMSHPVEGIPAVYNDNGSFLEQAFAWMKKRGRREVALLHSGIGSYGIDEWQESARAIARKVGIRIPESWIVPVHGSMPRAARHVVQLLLQLPPKQRPQGLIIGDDHLVEEATAGLLSMAGGLDLGSVPTVAHCNFPARPKALAPVTWLGFDSARVLDHCIKIIDRQRAGKSVPPITSIKACFEGDLSAMTLSRPASGRSARAAAFLSTRTGS